MPTEILKGQQVIDRLLQLKDTALVQRMSVGKTNSEWVIEWVVKECTPNTEQPSLALFQDTSANAPVRDSRRDSCNESVPSLF